MKILNLYAGIGGNRKLWGNEHEITAVELSPEIAAVYQQLYPNDMVVVADAHQYLLDHYKEFDFIWSSPPCTTHSKTNLFLNAKGLIRYPDMSLWQEILFLKQFAYDVPFVVENVVSYYDPMIEPTVRLSRHHIWSNRDIALRAFTSKSGIALEHHNITTLQREHDIYLPRGTKDVRKLLRNCVEPEVGLYILKEATK